MLDNVIQVEGDAGFVGYASRLNPVTLPEGMAQLSENMRLNRVVAQVRKGARRLADDISPAGIPLVVPFVLSPAPNEPVVKSSYTGGIFSSTVLRSPDVRNSMEVIVLAGSDKAYTFLTDGSLEFSEAWASGVLMVDGTDALVTEDGEELIVSLLPKELTYPTSPDETIEETDTVTMLQAFDRLYLLREADSSRDGWREQALTTGGITVSGTTATVNCPAHGYTAGMRVRLEGSTVAAFDGHEYDVATAAEDSFTVTVPSGTATDATTTGRTVRRVKAPLYWDGQPDTDFVRTTAGIPDVGPTYRRLRSVGWAAYINGRLIAPDGRDSVMLSDMYDPDLFDPYWQSFRANAGSNDYIVGVHPWVEGTALVFGRKSIWIAEISQVPNTDGSGFSIATGLSNLVLLTQEVGCSARRSVQTAGQFVYFLSDSGIYRLDSNLDMKLRGNTKPLSDGIDDQIKGLGAELIHRSVGIWFDNRYYLAGPLAGSEVNDGVWIYNALNEAWESQDVYTFGCDNLLVATYNNKRRLFASSRTGKLFLLDDREDGDDVASAGVEDYVNPIEGRLRTRRFAMGTMHSKRWLRAMSDVVLPEDAKLEIYARMVNPDKEFAVGSVENVSGEEEDYSVKSTIRASGHFLEMEFVSGGGRPLVRAATVEAAMATRAQSLTRTQE
jgi:hypothetical protein